jgi:hypothetical protein
MKYITKHSEDELQHFDSGAKRSDRTGKGRFDLISPVALRRLAIRYEHGAIQKGDRNWEGGFEISRCIDSTLRHLNQYREGDRVEDHLAAAAWNLFAAMHFEEVKPHCDDMPRYFSGQTQ